MKGSQGQQVFAVAGDDQVGVTGDGALKDAVIRVLGGDDGEGDGWRDDMREATEIGLVAGELLGRQENLGPARARRT